MPLSSLFVISYIFTISIHLVTAFYCLHFCVFSFNSSFSYPPTPTPPLPSVKGGDVHLILAFLPTEDIYSSLSREQDKDYFICWNTFKKHLQWKNLLLAGDVKKKKKPCEDDCNKCQQQNAFCNFTWFLDHFPYFEEKLPPETAPGRSTAGSKAVMTFLTALGLNPKGI